MNTAAAICERATVPVPGYVPERFRARLEGESFSFGRPPQAVRHRLASPERIRVADHAARYRVVTGGPHPGPWRHSHAPHTVKIMDTFGLPHVREVWFCAVEQSGKSNTMLNCLGWGVDCDPGDIFFMMPTEATRNKVVYGKLKPLLEGSPRLARHLSGRMDDLTMDRLALANGVTIHPAHANSAASLATWSAKFAFCDELDKSPPLVGREASPVVLIRKRLRLYSGRSKAFFGSTPAGLFIYKNTMACPQVWEWRARCPHCNGLERMEGERLLLPEGATVADIEAGGPVRYACSQCGSVWGEAERRAVIRAGRWLCVKGEKVQRPARVGFHHRAWDCLDVPLAEIAIAWLKKEEGGHGDCVAWANGYEAIDYVHEQQDRDEDYILRLVDEAAPRGVVPPGTSCLALLADTQQTGFFYQVWAFGYGRELAVSVIDHGYVLSFANLADIAATSYSDAAGAAHRVLAAFIDSGGGTDPHRPKHSRTAEVYEFCRRNPVFRPLKGRRTMEQPWNVTRLDYFPGPKGKKVPIPGGLNLYKINVTIYKNELAGKLAIEPDDPGAIRLHADIGSDYGKQMCAEYQDDHGWWLCPRGKPNHHWDISVYGLAAAEILGVRNFRRPGEAPATRRIYSRGVRLDD